MKCVLHLVFTSKSSKFVLSLFAGQSCKRETRINKDDPEMKALYFDIKLMDMVSI